MPIEYVINNGLVLGVREVAQNQMEVAVQVKKSNHVFFIDCLDTIFNEHRRKITEFGHIDVPDDVYAKRMKEVGYIEWFEHMDRNEYFMKVIKLLLNHSVICLVPMTLPSFWDLVFAVTGVIRSNLRMFLNKLAIVPFKHESLHNLVNPNHVLISRNQALVDSWKASGGIGIRYKNATQTYNQVKALIGEQNPIPF